MELETENPEKPGRILVVEDEKGVVEALTQFLEEQRIPTLATGSAHEALALVEKHHPDLILLDTEILQESSSFMGWEVLQEVKRRFPEIKVVAVTAYGDSDWHNKLLRLGADGLLLKPTGAEEIIIELLHALRGTPCRPLRRSLAALL